MIKKQKSSEIARREHKQRKLNSPNKSTNQKFSFNNMKPSS